MAVGPSTIETSRALILPRTQESFTFESARLPPEDHIRSTRRQRRENALRESQEIARSEMARRRRRLGSLTPEQESTIETLLISTVKRVSEIVMAVQESFDSYPIEKKEKVNVTE